MDLKTKRQRWNNNGMTNPEKACNPLVQQKRLNRKRLMAKLESLWGLYETYVSEQNSLAIVSELEDKTYQGD